MLPLLNASDNPLINSVAIDVLVVMARRSHNLSTLCESSSRSERQYPGRGQDLLKLFAMRPHDTFPGVSPRSTKSEFKLCWRLRPVTTDLSMRLVLAYDAIGGTPSDFFQYSTEPFAESLVAIKELLQAQCFKEIPCFMFH